MKDLVTVITGASSGIGRATALELARRGGTVVLAARRQAALEQLALECESAGGHALAVPVDVSDESAVETLARTAAESFGRVDVWVNNAAVTLFGRFEFSNGVNAVGLAPIERWRSIIERAKRGGSMLGVDDEV